MLFRSYGSLSRWVEGTDSEDRQTWITGIVQGCDYGWQGEAVSLTLETATWLDTTVIPSNNAIVDGSNWNDDQILSLFPEEQGLSYPIIYGCPGLVDASVSAAGWVTGAEGVWADHRHTRLNSFAVVNYVELALVIAGHHVAASSVWCNTEGNIQGLRFKVHNTADKRGQPVAVIHGYYSTTAADEWDSSGVYADYTWDDGTATVNGLGNYTANPDFTPKDATTANAAQIRVYVAFRDEDDLTRGGKTGQGGTLRGAGDILEDLLSYTNAAAGLGVDRGKIGRAHV